MKEKKYDIVVIGAGIIGMATAYYLKKNDPEKKILIIDKEAAAGAGNTAQSAAMYRDTFSSEVNFLLSSTTRDFFRHIQNDLGIALSLKDITYLWLMDREQFDYNKNAVETMINNNVRIEILEREDISRKIPELVTDFEGNKDAELLGIKNIDYGILGYDCGELDADKITRDFYENEFKKMGGETLYSTKVTKLVLEPKGEKLGIPGEPVGWQKKKIGAAETETGEIIVADIFVLATGPWANELALPLGINCQSMPLKKALYRVQHDRLAGLLDNEFFNQDKTIPFIIFPMFGLYTKPVKYNNSIWIGGGSVVGKPFEVTDSNDIVSGENPLDDFEADPRKYEYDHYLILSEYLPVLKDLPLTSCWAGYYAMNTIDKNPVIFKADDIEGLIIVTSASGSGIMKADAVARIADALYQGEEFAELYGGTKFKVSRLSLKNRDVDKEYFVI